MKITTPERHHLTAHDKKLIRYCLENRVDGCRTKKKRLTLEGGNLRKGITPTHARITTFEINAFGKMAEKTHRIPFNVNKPKPQKDIAPNHPELFEL